MSILIILIWLLNITCDTAGHVALKYAATISHASELTRWKMMASKPSLWVGVSCFALEFVAWLAFLSIVPLTQGVLLAAINMVTVVIAGKFMFKDRLDKMRILGISLITIGVILVGFYG